MAVIGFVGAGNMAEALIKGTIASKVYSAGDILISDISTERLEFLSKEYGVKAAGGNGELAAKADVIVLSVKPQNMDAVLGEISGLVKRGGLVISIAAGVKIQKISDALGDIGIIRAMPNTPALVGQGACGLFANTKGRDRLREAEVLFSAVGVAVAVEAESDIDTVTAVSGSGPAYFFLVMEEMIKAGIKLGLDKETAAKLVLQTAKGTAELVIAANAKGETPAELRKKVTSPGGTTQAALEHLAEKKFGQILIEAVGKAKARSVELSA